MPSDEPGSGDLEASSPAAAEANPKNWAREFARYQVPDNARGAFELAVSIIPFIALWLLMWAAFQVSYVLVLLLSLPAAGFLLRLFMIQHDCGHGSMFASQTANAWVGRVIGVLTLTPYDYWRRSHALHHAGSGNLDRRGIGDIDTLTVAEYAALSPARRALYRIYRHPFVLFVIGPAYLFLLRHRYPCAVGEMGRQIWWSVVATNAAIVAFYGALMYLLGWQTVLAIQLPITLLAASMGVWLFYIQHQFDPTHWAKGDDWNRTDAALHGSSYYDLPAPLMWITGNIGIHHVHHLSSRIPYHKLPQVLEDHPVLKDMGRLTFTESLKCVRLTLWDEEAKRLVPFSAARAVVAAEPA